MWPYPLVKEIYASVAFDLNCGPLSVLIVSPFVSASLYFIARLLLGSLAFFLHVLHVFCTSATWRD